MSPSFSSCSRRVRASRSPRPAASSACVSVVGLARLRRLSRSRRPARRRPALRRPALRPWLGRVLGHGLVSLGFFFGWDWPPDFFCCGGFPPVFFWGWLPPVFLRCWRDCFFGCWRWRGSLLLGHGRRLLRRLRHHAVLGRLRLVPLLLRLEGRRSRGGVVADHVELLAHGPQVRGGPVEEDADRERDAADGEDHGQHVEQQLLLLGVRARSARPPACSCSSAGAG